MELKRIIRVATLLLVAMAACLPGWQNVSQAQASTCGYPNGPKTGTMIVDMNEIKAITRAGMGACGGKTCGSLIKRAFRELGVPLSEVTENVARPVFVEVPLGVLAGVEE